MRNRLASAVLTSVLAVLGAGTVFPFVWMVLSAFKSNPEISAAEQTLLPGTWTFENFLSINDRFDFLRLFANSAFLAVTITAIVVYISVLAGYVLAKYRFRGRRLLLGFIISTMMLPGLVMLIPRYTMFTGAGLQDNYLALIIPAAVNGFGIFMMRQSMGDVPNEILEAARIDGASEIRIFHRIVLPMSTNAISALAIFSFLGVWDDYLWPYLMINTESSKVLAVGLTSFAGQYNTDYGGLFAATSIAVIPVIVVYVIFQRRFIAGVASSAIK